MNYEVKHIDGVVVFTLNEKKLDANISGLVKGEFTLLVNGEAVNRLVIDLSNVESCDSTGLSALLVANRLLNAKEGSLRLVSPSEKIMTLIKITQLDRVLMINNTVDDAVDELRDE